MELLSLKSDIKRNSLIFTLINTKNRNKFPRHNKNSAKTHVAD